MIPWYWQQLEHGVNRSSSNESATGLHGLVDANLNMHCPEVHLYLSVLISAGKDRDHKFINKYIEPICKWGGLDPEFVYKAFKTIWTYEDANKQKQ